MKNHISSPKEIVKWDNTKSNIEKFRYYQILYNITLLKIEEYFIKEYERNKKDI